MDAMAKMSESPQGNPGLVKTKSGIIADLTPITDSQPVADTIDRRIDAALGKALVKPAPPISDGLFRYPYQVTREIYLPAYSREPTSEDSAAAKEYLLGRLVRIFNHPLSCVNASAKQAS